MGEAYNVMARVRVPVSVLPSRDGVHVDDGVDLLLSAKVDDSIQPFQAFWFQYSWVQVVFEMAVVNRNSDAVETELGVEFGVFVGEESFEEL